MREQLYLICCGEASGSSLVKKKKVKINWEVYRSFLWPEGATRLVARRLFLSGDWFHRPGGSGGRLSPPSPKPIVRAARVAPNIPEARAIYQTGAFALNLKPNRTLWSNGRKRDLQYATLHCALSTTTAKWIETVWVWLRAKNWKGTHGRTQFPTRGWKPFVDKIQFTNVTHATFSVI